MRVMQGNKIKLKARYEMYARKGKESKGKASEGKEVEDRN
jgi:hypothetical protein